MADTGLRRGLDLLLSPAAMPARSGHIALTCLRILVGLIWLRNVLWKQPTDFNGLRYWTQFAVDYPVFPPYSWLIENLALPNFTPFGWGVLIAETTVAVLLLTGTAVKLAALLGLAQSIAIGLSVAAAPHEWPWAYAMMIGIHAVLFFTPSARYAAVDAIRAASPGTAAPIARRLIGGWGIALALTAVTGAWVHFSGRESRTVGIPGLEFSLGEYNLHGALALLLIALLMIAAATLSSLSSALAWGAAGLAAAAAITSYITVISGGTWLGATNTTAAVFISAAVVSAAAGLHTGQRQ